MLKEIIIPNELHIKYLIEVARKAICTRSKCGSIIISGNDVIGEGYNSQPCEGTLVCFKDSLASTFKSDKTCCVHAEQRAIMNAFSLFPDKVKGSTLLFIRLDENDEPKHFVLWHKEGWTAYETNHYNTLSFKL